MLSALMSGFIFDVVGRQLSASRLQDFSANSKWWGNGVSFGCTGCGKCCRIQGEVWLDIDEMVDASRFLNISERSFYRSYAETVTNGWIKLKNKINPDVSISDRCIFLDNETGKVCSIYSARPLQCRTYPYWPRLLMDKNAWDSEAAVPDDTNGRHWSAEEGGCEGINHKDAPVVKASTILRNMQLYQTYLDTFPFMKTGDDESRLFLKTDVIQGVLRSTRAWIDDVVIRYNLCPFAEAVFQSNTVRYRVFFGSDPVKIREKIKSEVLTLLVTPEEELSTTLLVLPFAFQDFPEFYEYCLDLEDYWIPRFEEEHALPPPTGGPGEKEPSALVKLLKKRRGVDADKPEPMVQLASFHPGFEWASVNEDEAEYDFDNPVNFEKRAPFPTLNLLRADRVRQWADQRRTGAIAGANTVTLESMGGSKLRKQFDALTALALDTDTSVADD